MGNLLLLPDSPQAYCLRPNSLGSFTFCDATSKSFSYRTNADGFRDKQRGAKEKGKCRVLVLGDSYVFGYAVREDESFPQVTERLLRSAGRRDIEVMNAGIPGYNTVQELCVLEKFAEKYRPDLVVLAYVMNDAEPQGAVPASPEETYRFAFSWIWEDLKTFLNTGPL